MGTLFLNEQQNRRSVYILPNTISITKGEPFLARAYHGATGRAAIALPSAGKQASRQGSTPLKAIQYLLMPLSKRPGPESNTGELNIHRWNVKCK